MRKLELMSILCTSTVCKINKKNCVDGFPTAFKVVYMYNYITHSVPRSLTRQFPRSNAISRCVSSGKNTVCLRQKAVPTF